MQSLTYTAHCLADSIHTQHSWSILAFSQMTRCGERTPDLISASHIWAHMRGKPREWLQITKNISSAAEMCWYSSQRRRRVTRSVPTTAVYQTRYNGTCTNLPGMPIYQAHCWTWHLIHRHPRSNEEWPGLHLTSSTWSRSETQWGVTSFELLSSLDTTCHPCEVNILIIY